MARRANDVPAGRTGKAERPRYARTVLDHRRDYCWRRVDLGGPSEIDGKTFEELRVMPAADQAPAVPRGDFPPRLASRFGLGPPWPLRMHSMVSRSRIARLEAQAAPTSGVRVVKPGGNAGRALVRVGDVWGPPPTGYGGEACRGRESLRRFRSPRLW